MPPFHTIDLHYLGIPQAIAAYVVIGPGGPVLIETGPASTLEHLTRGVEALGLKLRDIRHALVTHIHLDHAGAAGHLAANGTQIYVHEFGARHLTDPSRLIESAARIYGNQMDRLWGRILPVPEKQITPVHDGDVIDVCGLRFTAIETPGHARHHHAFALDSPLPLAEGLGARVVRASAPSPQPSPSGGGSEHICFAGDIAGISVPEIPEPPKGSYIAIPTPPPEFDLEAWVASIDRLLALNLRTIYLTHFGPRHNVAAHLKRIRVLVHEHAEFVRLELELGASRNEILRRYIEWNRLESAADGLGPADFARYVSTNLLTMNVDGLIRYWTRKSEQSALHGA